MPHPVENYSLITKLFIHLFSSSASQKVLYKEKQLSEHTFSNREQQHLSAIKKVTQHT